MTMVPMAVAAADRTERRAQNVERTLRIAHHAPYHGIDQHRAPLRLREERRMTEQCDARTRSPRRRIRVGATRNRKAAFALEKREQFAGPPDIIAGEPGLEAPFDRRFILTAKQQRTERTQRREALQRHGVEQAAFAHEHPQSELELFNGTGLVKNPLAHLDRGPAADELALINFLHSL